MQQSCKPAVNGYEQALKIRENEKLFCFKNAPLNLKKHQRRSNKISFLTMFEMTYKSLNQTVSSKKILQC